MRISASLTNAYEFACHAASCRPPGSGGTGGSVGGTGGGAYAGTRNAKGLDARNAKADTAAMHSMMRHAPGNAGGIGALVRAGLRTAGTGSHQKGKAPSTRVPAQIKDGKVHVDGAPATGKIGKRGSDVWHATLLAKHGGGHAMGNTRADLARNVQRHLDENAAQGRIGTKKLGAASVAQGGDRGRLQDLSATRAEHLSKIGPAKLSQVKVGRDGTVSIKGQKTDISISKAHHPTRYTSGYKVSGVLSRSGRDEKFFSTQAAAKAEVVRLTKAAAQIG